MAGVAKMGRKSIMKARASVMYPQGSEPYWDLRIKQEQQLLEESDDSEEAEPERRRKSQRRSSRHEYAAQEISGAEALEELVEKDRYLDEALETTKTVSQKLDRLKQEFEEAKRLHCLEVAQKDKDLKQLDKAFADAQDKTSEETRRRLYAEEQLAEVSDRLREEKDANVRLRQEAVLQAEYFEGLRDRNAGAEEREAGLQSELSKAREAVAQLEVDVQASEKQRLTGLQQLADMQGYKAQLQRAEEQIAQLSAQRLATSDYETQLATLRKTHADEILALQENHRLDLGAANTKVTDLEARIADLTIKLDPPRDDAVMRGKVDELRRENSRVREERRKLEMTLKKATTDLRRITRKNEQLTKTAAEASEQAALMPDLQRRVDELKVQLQTLPAVYDAGASAEQKVAGAKREMERSQQQEQLSMKLAEERLVKIEELTAQLQDAGAKLDTLGVEATQLREENTALTETVRELRAAKDAALAVEVNESVRASNQLTESKERDTTALADMKHLAQDIANRAKREVKDTEDLFPKLFGFKIAKGKGSTAWRVAPVSAAGRAQWKLELAVKREPPVDGASAASVDGSADGYVAVPSPLLTYYRKQPDANPDEHRPAVILSACALHLVMAK